MRQEELLAIISGAQGPSLRLAGHKISAKTGAELAEAFAEIPDTVISLDLSYNSLGLKTGAEPAQAFAAIPHSVTSLDLSCNMLYVKTGAELVLAFAAIPNSVTSLYLGYNNLGTKTGAELAQAFAAIPGTVTSLDLNGNNLDEKTGAELAQAFAAIPNSVTSLVLNWNDLGEKTGAELAQAFAAIPNSVTSLVLNGNNLYKKTSAELAEAFAAIPHSVRTINLAGNKLEQIGTVEEVGDLLLTMGRRIILGDTQFEQELERYMLGVYQQQAAQLVNSEASKIGIGCLSLVDEFLTGATASISRGRVRAQGQIVAKQRENNSTSPQTDPNSTSTAPLQVSEQRDSTPVRSPSDYLSNGEKVEEVEEKSQEAWKRTQRNRQCFIFNEPHQDSPNNTSPRILSDRHLLNEARKTLHRLKQNAQNPFSNSGHKIEQLLIALGKVKSQEGITLPLNDSNRDALKNAMAIRRHGFFDRIFTPSKSTRAEQDLSEISPQPTPNGN